MKYPIDIQDLKRFAGISPFIRHQWEETRQEWIKPQ